MVAAPSCCSHGFVVGVMFGPPRYPCYGSRGHISRGLTVAQNGGRSFHMQILYPIGFAETWPRIQSACKLPTPLLEVSRQIRERRAETLASLKFSNKGRHEQCLCTPDDEPGCSLDLLLGINKSSLHLRSCKAVTNRFSCKRTESSSSL